MIVGILLWIVVLTTLVMVMGRRFGVVWSSVFAPISLKGIWWTIGLVAAMVLAYLGHRLLGAMGGGSVSPPSPTAQAGVTQGQDWATLFAAYWPYVVIVALLGIIGVLWRRPRARAVQTTAGSGNTKLPASTQSPTKRTSAGFGWVLMVVVFVGAVVLALGKGIAVHVPKEDVAKAIASTADVAGGVDWWYILVPCCVALFVYYWSPPDQKNPLRTGLAVLASIVLILVWEQADTMSATFRLVGPSEVVRAWVTPKGPTLLLWVMGAATVALFFTGRAIEGLLVAIVLSVSIMWLAA